MVGRCDCFVIRFREWHQTSEVVEGVQDSTSSEYWFVHFLEITLTLMLENLYNVAYHARQWCTVLFGQNSLKTILQLDCVLLASSYRYSFVPSLLSNQEIFDLLHLLVTFSISVFHVCTMYKLFHFYEYFWKMCANSNEFVG